LIFRTIIWKYLSDNKGILANYATALNGTLVAGVTVAAMSSKPLYRTVLPLGFLGWMVALATNTKAVYFWSCGMTASLAQGTSHALAGEAGTLVVLQAENFDQTSYELSHATFFPNLIFQAVLSHMKIMAQ
jgi:hypothetical protein